MKLNIQSMHTPGLLLATNLVQLANSIAHARSLVAAAYSHAREIATAEANHEAADFCGDPYAHNCGRPHCRPSDSYTGPQPPLVRRFFEVDAIAEAAPPAAGVPDLGACPVCEGRRVIYDPYAGDDYRCEHCDGSGSVEFLTQPASENQRAVMLVQAMRELGRSYADQAAGPGPGWVGAETVAKRIRTTLDEFLRLNPHLQPAAPSQRGE